MDCPLLATVGALAVVTLGVAYLSFTSWNDGRLEEEDRRRTESFRPGANCVVCLGFCCWHCMAEATRGLSACRSCGQRVQASWLLPT